MISWAGAWIEAVVTGNPYMALRCDWEVQALDLREKFSW